MTKFTMTCTALLLIAVVLVRTALGQDASGSATISLSDSPPYTSPFVGISAIGYSTGLCPAGKTVMGIGGTKTKFIQKMTPLCASLDAEGRFTNPVPIDPSAIAAGGSGFRLQCASGKVVTRVGVSYNENTTVYPYLGGVQVGCGSWFGGNDNEVTQTVSSTGFDSWARKASVGCIGSRQPVHGIRVRAPTWAKAVSIICDEP